jgi:hypothetical protein
MRTAGWLTVLLACSSLKESVDPVVGPDASSRDADLESDRDTGSKADAGITDARVDPNACTSSCVAPKICVKNDAGGRCEVPTIRWFVDNVLVAEYATHEALYFAASSAYFLGFPYYGRSVQLNLPSAVATGNVLSCPGSGPVSLSLVTSDNSFAGLDSLPSRWKGLVFTSCGPQSSGDQVTALDVTISSVSPARVAGSYEIIVKGAGARANSTLRVTGVFDVAPTSM